MRPRTAELLFLLLEPARPVREKALIQLATQGDPDALEELVRFAAAAGPIGNERALAFRAIAASVRPPAPEVRRLLLAHRNDGDPFVRAAALDGLVRFADERLEPVFREGVADPELLVRQAAHEALRLLAEDPGAVPGAPAASFPAADPRPADRPVQAALLLDTAPLRGGEPVSGVAAGGSGSRQREAQRVRSLLDRLMPGGQGSLEEVTQQLAGLGSSACGPLLAELRCPTVLQRMAVAQALGRLGDRRVLDPLVARLKGPEAERDAQVVAVLLR
ncbi:MAG: hypothetical protein FJ125_18045, partial [Deltaproteobacteria bacterium]|nr:hypothetical protein [Deltaproteobacteria bacterium]